MTIRLLLSTVAAGVAVLLRLSRDAAPVSHAKSVGIKILKKWLSVVHRRRRGKSARASTRPLSVTLRTSLSAVALFGAKKAPAAIASGRRGHLPPIRHRIGDGSPRAGV
jgi:hypothetical protein